MTIEADITAVLEPLVDDRVYPDVAPAEPGTPYCVYQFVGGQPPVQFLETAAAALRNARVQVAMWATTRLVANDLGRQAEDALLLTATLKATALGAAVNAYDEETKLYGTRQDFSVWY